MDASGITWMPTFRVADLPSGLSAGAMAYALDGRAPTALGAVTLQAQGAGTGVAVTYNGKLWQITGTAISVSA